MHNNAYMYRQNIMIHQKCWDAANMHAYVLMMMAVMEVLYMSSRWLYGLQ